MGSVIGLFATVSSQASNTWCYDIISMMSPDHWNFQLHYSFMKLFLPRQSIVTWYRTVSEELGFNQIPLTVGKDIKEGIINIKHCGEVLKKMK